MTSSVNLTNKKEQQFRRLALLTVIIIYLVILAGGIVRGTGSGMGCPDWPRCFGQWVPPTDVSQLPSNYQEIYSHRGYANTAFNPVKTWIEYLNRLLGVLTGIFIFLTFITSIRFWKKDRTITVLSFTAFLLVGFEGWLGAKVVSNVLAPWIITLHMLLSIVIVGILLYVTARSYSSVVEIASLKRRELINRFLVIGSLVLLVQILLGTQVREEVDYVAERLGEAGRGEWADHLGIKFIIHRSFTWIVVLSQLVWYWNLRRQQVRGLVQTLGNAIVGLTIAQIATGILLAYFGMPAFGQPMHLTLSVITLGIQFVMILLLNRERFFPAIYDSRTNPGKAFA
nr:COX15/CtaA family protein [uncultured Arsenicibacter sp.]